MKTLTIGGTTYEIVDDQARKNKVDKTHAELVESLSMGRKENTTIGANSTALGTDVIASGENSHAEGYGTIAGSSSQHVQGKYNIQDSENKYAHIVGWGSSDTDRKNIHTVDTDGNGWFSGKLSQDGLPENDKDLTTKKYVDNETNEIKKSVQDHIEEFNTIPKIISVELPYSSGYRWYVNDKSVIDNGSALYKVKAVNGNYMHISYNNGTYGKETHNLSETGTLYSYQFSEMFFMVTVRQTESKPDIYVIPFMFGKDHTAQKRVFVKNNVWSVENVCLPSEGFVLTTTNSRAYTPTSYYHPATKKYVDDLLASNDHITIINKDFGMMDEPNLILNSSEFVNTGIYKIISVDGARSINLCYEDNSTEPSEVYKLVTIEFQELLALVNYSADAHNPEVEYYEFILPTQSIKASLTNVSGMWDGVYTTFVSNKYVDTGLRNKADKDHAEITGSLSMGRKSDTSIGAGSTALGPDVTASGTGSHAEGNSTIASGNYSHTEGGYTKATDSAAHAEGYYTEAGKFAHAEGNSTKALADQSHAEGHNTRAIGKSSHSEGYKTFASGIYSHIEGESYNCEEEIFETNNEMIAAWNTSKFARAAGNASHVEGRNSLAIGSVSHAEGHQNIAAGPASHAEGEQTTATGYYAHAEGKVTNASGNASHAEGSETTASGSSSHAEGYKSNATGDCCHAEGNYSKASGNWSHAQGFHVEAGASCAHAEGTYTKAMSQYQHVQGKFNEVDTENKYAHIVGNGSPSTDTDPENRSNAHTLDWNGNAWYQGSVTSNGADYAEFFEWLDGNPDSEDRVGMLVTLDGEKMKLANSGDEILGIISATAAVLGDNYECDWNGKYLTDDFGRILYDEVEEFVETPKTTISEILNEETGEVEISETTEMETQSLGFFKRPRINPDYDPEQAYVNRANRTEWDTVGMVGKLYLRDDGTCEVNSYATVGVDGVATASAEKTNIRVLTRVNENVVRVLLK